jgi:hypothetical protein
MTYNRIKIQLEGKPEENGDVRFDDFIEQLEATRKALLEVGRVVAEGDSRAIYYRVVNLSHSSPATVELEAVSSIGAKDFTKLAVSTFFTGLELMENKTEAPSHFDFRVFEAFDNLTRGVGTKFPKMSFSNNGSIIDIAKPLKKKIDKILGPDVIEHGSVTGMLERINLHKDANIFYLYPTFNDSKIKCRFGKDLREKAASATGKYVEVFGKLLRKRLNSQLLKPHEVIVRNIEILSSAKEVADLWSLRGIAEGTLGNKTSEQYVWELRDDWE